VNGRILTSTNNSVEGVVGVYSPVSSSIASCSCTEPRGGAEHRSLATKAEIIDMERDILSNDVEESEDNEQMRTLSARAGGGIHHRQVEGEAEEEDQIARKHRQRDADEEDLQTEEMRRSSGKRE
jgi:hypothetical protein